MELHTAPVLASKNITVLRKFLITTAWRVLGLHMEEAWRKVASILNKQLRTADDKPSFSSGY